MNKRFQTEEDFLNRNLDSILGKLGREFDSNDFIVAFQRLYPNDYAEALRQCDTYRALNVWIARWFLNSLVGRKILMKGDKKPRESINRKQTKNQIWIKL